MIENYVALDFETSNGNNPCSIGIAEFENGIVINEYYSLIKPKDLKFNPFAQRIHGISLKDVINEREFPEIWEEVKHLIEGKLIIAHSYGTERAILNNCFGCYGISKSDIQFECTLKLSRRYLDLDNHKLSTIANFFEIEQNNYHNALEDAIVCGKVYHKLITGNYSILKRKKISNNFKKEIVSSGFVWSKSNILEGIKIVVSGVFHQMSRNELKKAIEDNGGKVSSSISKKTNFIIAGDNMGPSKLTKAQDLGVTIISEQDFIDKIS